MAVAILKIAADENDTSFELRGRVLRFVENVLSRDGKDRPLAVAGIERPRYGVAKIVRTCTSRLGQRARDALRKL